MLVPVPARLCSDVIKVKYTLHILYKLAKFCKEKLSGPLTVIINKYINSTIFPNQLKVTRIGPKYKNGQTTEADSYQPTFISFISTDSKIIEMILLESLSTTTSGTPQSSNKPTSSWIS